MIGITDFKAEKALAKPWTNKSRLPISR